MLVAQMHVNVLDRCCVGFANKHTMFFQIAEALLHVVDRDSS
jgi:hypothetical protein